MRAGTDLVVRGSLDERSFVAFYCTAGRVLAAVAINRGRDLLRTVPLIRARRAMEPGELRNPDIDLRALA
ncbi:MAG TPA: oxidoreductase C-terminal domain-containing protein [Gaiella sp.]|nr:oxidoreductase C-terminal domain-containing protein [Gaiella sp.]